MTDLIGSGRLGCEYGVTPRIQTIRYESTFTSQRGAAATVAALDASQDPEFED
jgi:hypothetical protein